MEDKQIDRHGRGLLLSKHLVCICDFSKCMYFFLLYIFCSCNLFIFATEPLAEQNLPSHSDSELPVPGSHGGPIVPCYEMSEESIAAADDSRQGTLFAS